MKIREALATFQFGKKKVDHEKMYFGNTRARRWSGAPISI